MPEKNLRNIVQQYSRYWYAFILGVLVCVGLAYLYIHYYTIPQFKVYSTVLIKDNENEQSPISVDAIANSSKSQSRNLDNEIEILKSKNLMNRVIKELNISNSYYVAGRLHNTELFGSTLPIELIFYKSDSLASNDNITVKLKPGNIFELTDSKQTNKLYHFGQQIKSSYGTFAIIEKTKITKPIQIIIKLQGVKQVANYYSQALVVQPVNRNTSVLNISLVDVIPSKAERIINKLVEVYKKEAYEDKNAIAATTVNFLDNRLNYLTSDLSSVEKNVEKYKSSNSLLDINTQAESYTEQASKYNEQLSERAIQLDIIKSIEKYLQSNANSSTAATSTLGLKDEVLTGLISKFNELQSEKNRLMLTAQPNNPLVQNIDQQLTSLRNNILENLHNIQRNIQITANNLKENSGVYQNKIKRVPGMERELLEINRQKLIKQNVYSYLLQKREEAALSLAATTSIARTIDPATTIPYPININSQVLYLLAMLLGLGIPFAGIYIRNLLNNKVQSLQDVTYETEVRIIGEIAHNDDEEHIIISGNNRTPVAESFRFVRAALESITGAAATGCLTLLVTSGSSNEGKTFFSTNLGASLASAGKRVVLLNLDLNNTQSLIETYSLAYKGLGVTDYLMNSDLTAEEITNYSTTIPGLAVIGARPSIANQTELITSYRINHLIKQLKNNFDYIVIDTPPIGEVADTLVLNAFIDFTIYLVRYSYTDKATLSIIEDIRTHKTLKNPMIVLNDADRKASIYSRSSYRNSRSIAESVK